MSKTLVMDEIMDEIYISCGCHASVKAKRKLYCIIISFYILFST